MVSQDDLKHLTRCVELAREAVHAGDVPFGSVLVDQSGKVLMEDRNRTVTESNASLHPEFSLALWAQKHLSPSERAAATVYTSGEHCPMCSTLHANVGLGRIVYVSSSEQLMRWREELGVKAGPVRTLMGTMIVSGVKRLCRVFLVKAHALLVNRDAFCRAISFAGDELTCPIMSLQVLPLAINQVAPQLKVEGPIEELFEDVRELHREKAGKQ
jgi:tRNA(Arg) A34 adenosine deaminase TadA